MARAKVARRLRNEAAAEDTQQVVGVPMENEQRVAEIDAKIREHMEAINALKTDRNILAPWISRIPEEILAYIFSILPREPDLPYAYESKWPWVTVTRVCKLWHRVALETPRLWSHIDLSFKHDVIEANLRRSAASALTIRVHGQELSTAKVAAKYRLILQNWSRINDIEVTGITLHRSDWQRVHSAVNGDASGMQRLCLKVPYASSHSPNRIIDCSKIIQRASSLKSLRLCGVVFDWAGCSLKNLTDLTLESIFFNSKRPALAQILNLLALSTTLEELRLIGIGPLDSPLESCLSLKLPKLRKFSLAGVESEVCGKMLQFIELPSNVDWYIHCTHYSMAVPVIIYPKLSAPKSGCKALYVILHPNKLTVQSKVVGKETNYLDFEFPYEEHLSLEGDAVLPEGDFSQAFNALSKLVNGCNWKEATNLEIRVNREETEISVEKDHWMKLLGLFTDLRCLCCDFGGTPLDASSEEHLAQALKEVSSSDTLLYPRLEELELQSANFSERRGEFHFMLCDTLEFRYDRGFPIKSLIIGDGIEVHDHIIEELEEIVDDVDWDGQELPDESEEEEYFEDEDFYDSDHDYL